MRRPIGALLALITCLILSSVLGGSSALAKSRIQQGAGATSTGPAIDYFALGDSIASGYGLNADSTPCHRSASAYPRIVAQFLRARHAAVNTYLFACAGATTTLPSTCPTAQGCTDPGWFHTQVAEVLQHLSSRPTLVSITVGVNDLHFENPIDDLYHLDLQTDTQYAAYVQAATAATGLRLASEVALLTSHPNVHVILTTYFNPFNPSSIYFGFLPSIPGGCVALHDCWQRTELGLTSMNASIAAVATLTHSSLTTDMETLAAAHRSPRPVCGASAPDIGNTWVQYPGEPGVNSPNPILSGVGGDCVHPNYVGTLAFALAVDAAAQASGF